MRLLEEQKENLIAHIERAHGNLLQPPKNPCPYSGPRLLVVNTQSSSNPAQQQSLPGQIGTILEQVKLNENLLLQQR